MIKAVLFDLDHTLYDREATLISMAPAMGAALGIPQPVDEIVRALLIGEEEFYLKDFSYGGPKAVYPALCRFLTMPAFEAYNDFINSRLADFVVPYPFVAGLLLFIRSLGLRTGIVTNGRRAMQLDKVLTLGIDRLIDNLTCADDSGSLKPSPEIFMRCINTLGVAPTECVYVGDNPIDDVQGAINTGMLSVWIKGRRPYPAGLPGPDYAVDSVRELLEIIPRLG